MMVMMMATTPSVNASSRPLAMPWRLPPRPPGGGRAPRRDRGERKRNQHVIPGERQAEKAPRGLVAAHEGEIGEGGQKVAAGRKIGQRPGALLRARPPFPLDAGVKQRKPGVEQ